MPARDLIVGREDELALLRRACGGAGGPSLVLLSGEAGVGKSTLQSAVAAEAAAAGIRVLWTRPTQAEASGSYAALDDLVRPVLDGLPDLPEPQRRALASALGLEEAQAPVEPRLVGLACLTLLGRLDAPVLLAVDDWQWLDAASAAVLAFVLRRLTGTRATVLATLRTGEADEAVAALVHGLADGESLILEVPALSGVALQQLVGAATGVRLSPPALERLLRASGGNPLVALELVREPNADAVTDIRRLLGRRIGALSPDARAVLRFAAALPDPAADLVEAAGEAPAAARRGLEEALAADVVRRVGSRLRFSHPLLATVVEERTPPGEWRDVHARLAGLATQPEQRARHLHAAATGPDEGVAQALERAAQDAIGRGATAAAGELAERAVAATPADDQAARLRRTLAAADAHMASADGARAHDLLAAMARELPAGPGRARVLQRLAYVSLDESAHALASQALAEAAGDDALLADVHLHLSIVCALSGLGFQDTVSHGEAALRHAERSGQVHLMAGALTNLGFIRGVAGEGVQRDLLGRAAALEREAAIRPWDSTALEILGMQLYVVGLLDEGRDVLLAERDRTARAGHMDLESFADLLLAELEVRAGRWGAAEAHARRCREMTLGSDLSNSEAAGLWACGFVDAHLGRVGSARELLGAAREQFEHLDDLAWTTRCDHGLGFVELSLGDAAQAVALLAPLPAHERGIGIEEPALFCIAPDLAEALVLTGDLVGARAVQAQLEARGRALDRPWAIATALRCRGQIAAADGRLAEALADLEAALEAHARLPQPFERARTELALGVVQRRAKQRGSARASLEGAKLAFESLGAGLWVDRAAAEIARLGGRRRREGDELTETERRIAELAGRGRSNREIAGELYVAERTVEANLTRAYRKLGVRSRTELARLLPDDAEDPGANRVGTPLSGPPARA